jgi:hypothetical protein
MCGDFYLNFGSLVFALLHVAFKDAPEKSTSDSGGKSEVILLLEQY